MNTKNSTVVWLVGKLADSSGEKFEIQGIFSTKEKALVAIRDESHFMGPFELDKEYPQDTVNWDGAYYPLLESDPSVADAETK